MIRQEDIIKPLLFLDIFDYPPTAMELWRFLGVPAELGEIVPLLSKEGLGVVAVYQQAAIMPEVCAVDTHPVRPGRTPLQGGEYNGFYFLPSREALVEKRREFFHLSEKKFRIAKRAAWLLHFIPSIRMIAVCNNFYYRPQSDIDFFIITKKNRLWLTRFFATIILDIFHLRARGEETADKICLSFYLSENNLNLEKIAFKINNGMSQDRGSLTETDSSPGARNDKEVDDPYLAYWLAFLEPIYGQECYNKFWEANAWLKNIFPNVLPKMPVPRRCVGANRGLTTPNPSLKRRGNAFGDWLENVVKKIQWRKLSLRVKDMAALCDKRVVINEAMLKFHENDRREFFREEFNKKIIKNI